MRVKRTLKNSFYAITSYLLLSVLAIFVRKTFLWLLPIEFLGYEGLFGNIFSLIAIADLGIESIILYRLFPAFVKKKHDDINRLMRIYKLLYKNVGITIFIIGIALVPFLHIIISQHSYDWNYLYLIYFSHLFSTLCTYFMAYKRIIFRVNQEEYECTKIDTYILIIFDIVKILFLVLFRSYFLYILCNLVANLLSNIIISYRVNKKFTYLDLNIKANYKDIKEDIKSLGISRDIKNTIIQKISGVIYGGTDNIVVSIMLGMKQTGLLANYLLISGYISSFFQKILQPFQASIGNYVHSESKEISENLFHMFDFISYMLACIICVCYINLFNPTISVLFGSQYLLNMDFVCMFVCNQYITWNHLFVVYYRYSFGNYELDRLGFIVAAILNVISSIILCKFIGLAGVMFGTVISNFILWCSRIKALYSVYIKEDVYYYIKRQIIRIFLCFFQCYLIYSICSVFPISIFGVLIRLAICPILSISLNILIYLNTKEIKDIVDYFGQIIQLFSGRK